MTPVPPLVKKKKKYIFWVYLSWVRGSCPTLGKNCL